MYRYFNIMFDRGTRGQLVMTAYSGEAPDTGNLTRDACSAHSSFSMGAEHEAALRKMVAPGIDTLTEALNGLDISALQQADVQSMLTQALVSAGVCTGVDTATTVTTSITAALMEAAAHRAAQALQEK